MLTVSFGYTADAVEYVEGWQTRPGSDAGVVETVKERGMETEEVMVLSSKIQKLK